MVTDVNIDATKILSNTIWELKAEIKKEKEYMEGLKHKYMSFPFQPMSDN